MPTPSATVTGLEPKKGHNQLWLVLQNEQIVGEIHLDCYRQVDEVMLFADTSADIQLAVLRLAASHASRYVRSRRTSNFLFTVEHRDDKLTDDDSDRLMQFGEISDAVAAMSRNDVIAALKPIYVEVHTITHRSYDDAMDAAIADVGIEGLTFEVIPEERPIFNTHVKIRFTVKRPHRFIFWKGEIGPFRRDDLHIVAPYHPAMNGKTYGHLINGDTDALIRGSVVRSIFCPEVARAERHRHNSCFGSSWHHVRHPFCATSREVVFKLIYPRLRTAEGVAELSSILKQALGLDPKCYIGVSGGFAPPLRCAHNRIVDLGIESPCQSTWLGSSLARGSEAHCVWAHRVLQKEGKLSGAFIPDWFHKEGWLKIYEGAECAWDLF